MNIQRKQILDQFEKYLFENYKAYTQKHQLSYDMSGMLAFMIDYDLVSTKAIQQYTVVNEFKALLPRQKYQKTKTVLLLADRFNLSERSIWAILKRSKTRKTTFLNTESK